MNNFINTYFQVGGTFNCGFCNSPSCGTEKLKLYCYRCGYNFKYKDYLPADHKNIFFIMFFSLNKDSIFKLYEDYLKSQYDILIDYYASRFKDGNTAETVTNWLHIQLNMKLKIEHHRRLEPKINLRDIDELKTQLLKKLDLIEADKYQQVKYKTEEDLINNQLKVFLIDQHQKKTYIVQDVIGNGECYYRSILTSIRHLRDGVNIKYSPVPSKEFNNLIVELKNLVNTFLRNNKKHKLSKTLINGLLPKSEKYNIQIKTADEMGIYLQKSEEINSKEIKDYHIDKYVDESKPTSYYGGNDETEIISHIFKVSIVSFINNGVSRFAQQSSKDYDDSIYITNVPNHWRSVQPI